MSKLTTKFRLFLILCWAQLMLWWERLLAVLFPAILFPLAFLALAWFGLFEQTGDPVRLLALVFSGFCFFWFLRKSLLKKVGFASVDAQRRVEDDNGLAAGSLASLYDRPAAISATDSQILWEEHKKRTQQGLRFLRFFPARAIWAKTDVLALRVLVFLAVFSGFIIAGKKAEDRLLLALYPGLLLGPEASVSVEAWINPPQYTNLPPIFLSNTTADTGSVAALAGSEFVVRVSQSRRRPSLSIIADDRKKIRLSELGEGVFEAKVILQESTLFKLSAGADGTWNISKRKDSPPQITFVSEPIANERDELAFRLAAHDDFAVEQVWLILETRAKGNFPKTDRIKLPISPGRDLNQKIEHDFTRHLFAGMPVQLRLEAVDGAGQSGQSSTRETILPEKLLIKPLAKAIAEQRLLVMRDINPYLDKGAEDTDPVYIGDDRLFTQSSKSRLRQAPEQIQRAAALMSAVMRAPEFGGIDDLLVWIGLSYVQERLRKAKTRDDLDDLDQEMWEIVLQAEGGELESALAAMKLAEKALQNALLLSAPGSELQRLSQKYEAAVKRYLQALAKAALQEKEAQGGGSVSAMSADQLQEMLDALQALAETGATKDARSLLRALAELLQNMKMQLAAGGQGGGQQNIIAEAMRKALEELGEMLGEQREILDRIQQQLNAEGQPDTGDGIVAPGVDPGALKELSEQQAGVLGRLDELENSGQLSTGSSAEPGLDAAQKAMTAAKRALEQGQAEKALDSGQQAFGQLRAGAEELAQEILEVLQNNQGRGRDAFGRAGNAGGLAGGDALVPDLIDPERAREILNELRRRASERGRPAEELQYLDRLLERF